MSVLESKSFFWEDEKGQPQGFVSVSDAGEVILSPDDDFYCGRLSREDSIQLAKEILSHDE